MTKIFDVYQKVTKQASTVFLRDSIQSVRKKMVKRGTVHRSIYVVDENYKLVGIITLKEILKAIAVQKNIKTGKRFSKGKFLGYIKNESTAQDIMHPPISVRLSDSIENTLAVMIQNNMEELPVVDEHQTLLGDVNAFEFINEID
ncbi:CBS domain-containing protein [Alteribacillus sp. JSM 102045]|uniref:CBS domain-containing protein n=1 Tax=Alteribacillus sp. JSM 102045 TaxID=1562101 RepID=UPI0035C2225A